MIALLNEHDAEVGMTDTMLATKLCTMIKYQQIQQSCRLAKLRCKRKC